MSATQVRGLDVWDGSVCRNDLNVLDSGKAVIRRILEVASSGIKVTNDSTGADPGTGDVKLAVDYLVTQAKLNGTGLVRMTGTSVSYDNTTYYHAGNLPAYPTSLPANGGNADTVDYLHAADFFRVVRNTTLAIVDATASTSGYYVTESKAIAVLGAFNHIIHLGGYSAGGFAAQLAIPFESGTNNGAFIRVAAGTTFGSWYKMWSENNDGTGSGLDADLLDGQHGTYYSPTAHTHNFIKSEYISGGLELPNYFGGSKLKLNMLWVAYFGGWADCLWMDGYGGADVKRSNQLVFGKTTNNIGFRQQDYDATTWGAINTIYHSGNLNRTDTSFTASTGTFSGSVTAPSFIGNLTGTASNAVTFDGSEKSGFMRYNASYQNSINLDLMSTGIALNTTGNGTGNLNFSHVYGTIATFDAGYFKGQISFDPYGEFQIRGYNADTYNPWRKVWDSTNLNRSDVPFAASTGTFAGSVTVNGNEKGYYLGQAGYLASIIYNSNGDLDITPRSGYKVNVLSSATITGVANVGGFRVGGNTQVTNGEGLEIYFNPVVKTTYILAYDRGITDTYHPIAFGASDYQFNWGNATFAGSVSAAGGIFKGVPLSQLKTVGTGANSVFSMLSQNGLYGLFGGVSSDGHVWLQVGRNDGDAAIYPLAIQSLGGLTKFGGDGLFEGHLTSYGNIAAAGSGSFAGSLSLYGPSPILKIENTNTAAVGNRSDIDFFNKSVGWTNTKAAQISVICSDSYGGHGDIVFSSFNTDGIGAFVQVERLRIGSVGATFSGSVTTAGGFTGKINGPAHTTGADGWWRSDGDTGWYNQTYAVGIFATEAGMVRTYNGASFYAQGGLSTGGIITAAGNIHSSTYFKSDSVMGMVGNYDVSGTTEKSIWTIGTQWNTVATMYGIGYDYEVKAGFGHSIFFKAAGAKKVWISLSNGSAHFDGDVRASNFLLGSDRRIKTQIENISEKGITAEYKQFYMKTDLNDLRYGVIAQDLLADNPELVCGNEEDGYTVKYIDLLIKEVAYLKRKVGDLERRAH